MSLLGLGIATPEGAPRAPPILHPPPPSPPLLGSSKEGCDTCWAFTCRTFISVAKSLTPPELYQ